MTAQEIFRLPAIDFIEAEICNLYWQYEQHCYYNKAEKEAIKQLLAVRKRLLDKEFVMDDHYKQLLNDFNKAMTEPLLQMRFAVISAYNAVKQTAGDHDVIAIGSASWHISFLLYIPNSQNTKKRFGTSCVAYMMILCRYTKMG